MLQVKNDVSPCARSAAKGTSLRQKLLLCMAARVCAVIYGLRRVCSLRTGLSCIRGERGADRAAPICTHISLRRRLGQWDGQGQCRNLWHRSEAKRWPLRRWRWRRRVQRRAIASVLLRTQGDGALCAVCPCVCVGQAAVVRALLTSGCDVTFVKTTLPTTKPNWSVSVLVGTVDQHCV
jgi:hypothetical protein